MAYIKPLQFSSPVKDGSCSGFVFSEEWCQTAFLQFGYHLRVVQWGETHWLWVSIRARYILLAHDFACKVQCVIPAVAGRKIKSYFSPFIVFDISMCCSVLVCSGGDFLFFSISFNSTAPRTPASTRRPVSLSRAFRKARAAGCAHMQFRFTILSGIFME